ncbi:MAG: alpha/beta hydrolase [Patescibacteria group bacterium]
MKNLLILHGSYGNPHKNWYQYVGIKAQEKGYVVNIPQLHHIDELDLDKIFQFLLEQNFINSETVIIGHSSGAAYILGILQRLPKDSVIQKAILVAGFVDAHLTKRLFQEVPQKHYFKLFPKRWNWRKIRQNCRKFIIIHSTNDPYIQMRHAKTLQEKLDGKLVIIDGGQHFSVNSGGERFKKFPDILQYLE